MPKIDLTILDTPLWEDDYDYIRDNAPLYLQHIQQALDAGYTPDQIYHHYMKLAPHRHPFWLRCKHAAKHIVEDKKG